MSYFSCDRDSLNTFVRVHSLYKPLRVTRSQCKIKGLELYNTSKGCEIFLVIFIFCGRGRLNGHVSGWLWNRNQNLYQQSEIIVDIINTLGNLCAKYEPLTS